VLASELAGTVIPTPYGQLICTPCPDFRAQRKSFKHIVEVLFRFYADTIAPPSPEQIAAVTGSKKEWYAGARRFKHVPYRYEEGLAESTRMDNAAVEQPNRIKELLAEVVWMVDKRHPRYGVGRPPISPGSKVFASVLREYRRVSMRRFRAEIDELEMSGVIKVAPCKTKIVEINSDPETTQYLIEVFKLVTEPFRLMEVHTISDATAFSPLYVSNWLDSDYGRDNYRAGTIWFKQHTTVGRISSHPGVSNHACFWPRHQ
jgi:hypothetical protein